jgi:hypothetical protein
MSTRREIIGRIDACLPAVSTSQYEFGRSYVLLQAKNGSVLLLGDAVSINYRLIKLVGRGGNETSMELK